MMFDLQMNQVDSCVNNISDPAEQAYLKHYQLFLSEMVLNNREYNNSNEEFKRIAHTISNSSNTSADIYLSEIYLHRGVIEYQNNNNLSALRLFSKAYSYWQQSEEKYPDLIANLKLEGIFNLLIGNLPMPYADWVRWLGPDGDTQRGFDALQQYLDYQYLGTGARQEALLYMGFAWLKFSDDQQAIKRFVHQEISYNHPEFLQSLICRCAFKIREPDLCSKWLSSTHKVQFVPLIYLQGKYATQKGLKVSPDLFNLFFKVSKGETFKADALRYLSWYDLLKNDSAAYYKHQRAIANLKSYPTSEDRQALYENELDEIPDVDLLTARLLFDRGDDQKAIECLTNKKPHMLSDNNKLEFCYRLGRCYQVQNRPFKAMEQYNRAILLGDYSTRYFAPYSAVYLAQIYLKQGNTEKVKFYLSEASRLNNGEYKFSIKQQIDKLEKAIADLE
jgi:hypothetical protein